MIAVAGPRASLAALAAAALFAMPAVSAPALGNAPQPTLARNPAPTLEPADGDGPPRAGAVAGSSSFGPSSSRLYVVRRGWHVDVGFDADALTLPLRSVAAKFPGVRYLLFGFGDRRYFMSKHHGGPVLLEALWPGAALILTTALTAPPADAFGAAQVIELRLSRAQSAAAQLFVWRALTHEEARAESPHPTDESEVQVFARGPYPGSLYFPARTRYSALHTCNTWAAEVLEAAGYPVRSSGVLFAGQVWSRARRLAATESSGGGTDRSDHDSDQ